MASSITRFSKKILGLEKTPESDVNDPKYQEMAKRDREAGAKFARFLRLDKFAGWLQAQANAHPKRFLAIAFGIPIFFFSLNIYRMSVIYSYQQNMQRHSYIMQQEKKLIETHRFPSLEKASAMKARSDSTSIPNN